MYFLFVTIHVCLQNFSTVGINWKEKSSRKKNVTKSMLTVSPNLCLKNCQKLANLSSKLIIKNDETNIKRF